MVSYFKTKNKLFTITKTTHMYTIVWLTLKSLSFCTSTDYKYDFLYDFCDDIKSIAQSI